MVEPFRQKSQLFANYIILGVGDHKFCAVASCKQDAGEGKERKWENEIFCQNLRMSVGELQIALPPPIDTTPTSQFALLMPLQSEVVFS